MVYNQKFVVVIKVNGRVLREKGDTVHIPFGSEYSITLKNLNTVKAVASIEVDGGDVMDGLQVIVPANESVTIEGFMKGRKVKNRFKFIEKTDQISAFRGDKASDGLVRVSYQFEYQWPQPLYYSDPCPCIFNDPIIYDYDITCNDHILYGSTSNIKYAASQTLGASCDFKATKSLRFSSKVKNKSNVPKSNNGINCCAVTDTMNENGITVKGSKSGQKFVVGSVGLLDAQKYVIVLQLKGKLKNKKVYKAVTVKTKIQCETCGKKNRSKNKFCNNCGTSLI